MMNTQNVSGSGPAGAGIGGRRSVILVDDDLAVRDSLRVLLELYGYQVRDYGSAQECLDEPNLGQAGCIVVDFHMPGLTGLGLIRRLRERGDDVPAILITGAVTPAIRRETEILGVHGPFEKPSENGLLLAAIASAFRS